MVVDDNYHQHIQNVLSVLALDFETTHSIERYVKITKLKKKKRHLLSYNILLCFTADGVFLFRKMFQAIITAAQWQTSTLRRRSVRVSSVRSIKQHICLMDSWWHSRRSRYSSLYLVAIHVVLDLTAVQCHFLFMFIIVEIGVLQVNVFNLIT